MKKLLLPIILLGALTFGCHQEKEEPASYNRPFNADSYERNFRSHVFAACMNEGKPYATYSLARINQKPNECDPRYKVTFANGPCKGETVWTTDVIERTSPVGGGQLLKGQVVLRDYWNPRTLDRDTGRLMWCFIPRSARGSGGDW